MGKEAKDLKGARKGTWKGRESGKRREKWYIIISKLNNFKERDSARKDRILTGRFDCRLWKERHLKARAQSHCVFCHRPRWMYNNQHVLEWDVYQWRWQLQVRVQARLCPGSKWPLLHRYVELWGEQVTVTHTQPWDHVRVYSLFQYHLIHSSCEE